MRRIEVLLSPANLDEIKDALGDIGVHSMTLSEVKVVDPAHRRREVYRGTAYVVDFALKVKMDLVVEEAAVPGVLRALEPSLGAARADDVQVFLGDAVETVRIRMHSDPERGDDLHGRGAIVAA
jgi:nitrogen regulatory protein P-II 1